MDTKDVAQVYLPEPEEGRRAILTFVVDSINKDEIQKLLLGKRLGVWGTRLDNLSISIVIGPLDESLEATMQHRKLKLLSIEELKTMIEVFN